MPNAQNLNAQVTVFICIYLDILTLGMLLCGVSAVGHLLQISHKSHHRYQYGINNSYLITCTVIQSLYLNYT